MTADEMEMLDFEREWWRHAGTKEVEVLKRWGLSPAQYGGRLLGIALRPEALEYDPLTVRRIRRRLVPTGRPYVAGR